jgi:hypothetical protein
MKRKQERLYIFPADELAILRVAWENGGEVSYDLAWREVPDIGAEQFCRAWNRLADRSDIARSEEKAHWKEDIYRMEKVLFEHMSEFFENEDEDEDEDTE